MLYCEELYILFILKISNDIFNVYDVINWG